MKYHRITTIAGLVLGTAALTATAANAVTYNPGGTGFIGKGEVQSAFGMNNATIQKVVNDNVNSFTFTTKQDATQALTQALSQSGRQDGTQTGTQSGTQSISQSATQDVIETLSCTKTNGNVDQRFRVGSRDGERSDTRTATRTAEREAHRDGSRTGVRYGTRAGVRYGTRAGSLNGTLNASIDASARKTGQWTGWNVNGFTSSPKFDATGSTPQFPVVDSLTGDYTFGGWSFAGSTWEPTGEFGNFGSYDLGDYEWSPVTWATTDYVADPGNNDPDGVCKEGASNVLPGSVKLVVTYGDIHENDKVFDDVAPGTITENEDVIEAATHDGPVVPGETAPGAVTPTGAVKTFATYNSNTKQIG